MIKITDIPFKIRRKISVFLTNLYVKKKFVNSSTIYDIQNSSTKSDILNELVYKDDSWNYISHLVDYMDYSFKKKQFYLNDNSINIKRFNIENNVFKVESTRKKDNWVCFFYDNSHNNYKLEYEFISYSDLDEIQIAFNYKSLADRYRFMIHKNSKAVFECVYRGVFYLNIFNEQYIIHKNVKYKVSLVVIDNHYEYYINDKLIFSVTEDGKLVNGKDIMLIFYNHSDNDDVKVDLLSCNISAIN